MDFVREGVLEGDPKSHWYTIAKHRAIKALIGAEKGLSVLEIGPSSGAYSQLLVEDGVADAALCVNPDFTEEWMGRRRSDRVAYLREIESVEAGVVLAVDALQHEEDGGVYLQNYARLARPGARFVVSAPASNLPAPPVGGEGRVYSRAKLEAAVVAAGLEVVETRYFFSVIAGPAALLGLAAKAMRSGPRDENEWRAPPPHWIHRTLLALHDAEREFLFPHNRFTGASVICLAQKPAHVAQKADAG